MKDNRDRQKAEFAARLNQAAQESSKGGRGIYAAIKREFTDSGNKISEQAVRQWFEGGSMPSDANMRRLARYFKVRSEWLRYGPEGGAMREVDAVLPDGSRARIELHKIPVLTPVQYPEWLEGRLSTPIQEHVHVTGELSPDAFAFTLPDNSALPFAARGMRAVVDPKHPQALHPVTAEYLVVTFDNGVFLVGRYSVRGSAVLEPTNSDFKPLQLSPGHIVTGVMVKLAQRDL